MRVSKGVPLKQLHSTSYVSAQPPVQAEPKPVPTREGISAQVQGNAAGGIGAMAIVVAGWLIVWGILHAVGLLAPAWPNPVQVIVGAAIAGLLTFGVLSFVRNSLDEAFDVNDRLRMQTYITELEQGISLRNERIKALIAELESANLTASVAPIKATTTFVAPEQRLGPEWKDAQELVVRRWNGQSWGRDALRSAGWTDKRWDTAMEVVYRAGVAVKGKGSKGGYVPWDTKATLPQALAYINRHREMTLDALRTSVASSASYATTDSDATSDTGWGRGGEL